MTQGAALLFLRDLEPFFADRVLHDAMQREHFGDTRDRLSRLAMLDGEWPGNMTKGGKFAARCALDVLTAFDRHAAADPAAV